jgi:hypothetical protein
MYPLKIIAVGDRFYHKSTPQFFISAVFPRKPTAAIEKTLLKDG